MAFMKVIDTFRLWDCDCEEKRPGMPLKMQRRSDLEVIATTCPNRISPAEEDIHNMNILVGAFNEWHCNHCGHHLVEDIKFQEVICGRCGSSVREWGVESA
jgi:hypothetical protein